MGLIGEHNPEESIIAKNRVLIVDASSELYCVVYETSCAKLRAQIRDWRCCVMKLLQAQRSCWGVERTLSASPPFLCVRGKHFA